MCLMAGAIIGAVLSVAQAAVGFAQQQQAADDQNAYFESNRRASVVAGTDRYASLNNQLLQKREAAAAEMFNKRIEAMKARSTAKVSAGEANVTGLSVNALMDDLDRQHARQLAAIKRNYEFDRNNTEDELVATRNNTISRINSVRQARGPSGAAFALQAAGGVLGAFKGA